MAVHLPLTVEAQKEAEELMITSKNMLNPSNGEPIITPDKDMVLGCYYLTRINEDEEIKYSFASIEDTMPAYESNTIKLNTPINYRLNHEIIKTTY
jgi:DNA-directed RNA polymerase subunit beta'